MATKAEDVTALVLDPHGDDAALFCAFAAMSTDAYVSCILRSQIQQDRYGISAETREAETDAAMRELGLSWEHWEFLDSDPPWDAIRRVFEVLAEGDDYDPVFAPAVEPNGHDHHSEIGRLALEVFGPDRVTSYLTYTRIGGRSTNGVEVVPEPDWIVRKHRALACYRSQIAEPSCREHFLRDIREYIAE